MLNLTRSLYLYGNAYALALRNNRFEIDELHLMQPELSFPRLAETGEIFYELYGNEVVEKRLGSMPMVIPARDVLHIKLHTSQRYPRPLVGESPITAAMADVGVGNMIKQQQAAFYGN